MAVSSTYGAMQQQIAVELGYRTDLLTVPMASGITLLTLSPIQTAIQNAIAKWERKHFYFNEVEGSNAFTTVVGQEFYTAADAAVIGTNPHIDKLWVYISGNRYSLNPRTEQYISDTSLNPSNNGQPIDYAYYAESIRMYPIPDGAYPCTIEGVQRFTTLTNDTDANVWTQDAEALIRTEAKIDLLINTIKSPELAADQKRLIYGDAMEQGYLYALMGETTQRAAVGRFRAMYF